MKEFVGLKAKTCSYLINDGTEEKKTSKKTTTTKKCAIRKKRKFKDYKNCLEATQLENKISHLERNKIDVDSLRGNHNEFIKIIIIIIIIIKTR